MMWYWGTGMHGWAWGIGILTSLIFWGPDHLGDRRAGGLGSPRPAGTADARNMGGKAVRGRVRGRAWPHGPDPEHARWRRSRRP